MPGLFLGRAGAPNKPGRERRRKKHSGLVLFEHLPGFLNCLLPFPQVLVAHEVDVFFADEEAGLVVSVDDDGIDSGGGEGLVHHSGDLLLGDGLRDVGIEIKEDRIVGPWFSPKLLGETPALLLQGAVDFVRQGNRPGVTVAFWGSPFSHALQPTITA